MSYQQNCEDFALYSSPFQEHCEDSSSDDYHTELWASEAEIMRQEGEREAEHDEWIHSMTDLESYNYMMQYRTPTHELERLEKI